MAWATRMRDRIHLESRKESERISYRKRSRLNRIDNTSRAMHTGFATVWTRKQRNARRRIRQGRVRQGR